MMSLTNHSVFVLKKGQLDAETEQDRGVSWSCTLPTDRHVLRLRQVVTFKTPRWQLDGYTTDS